MPISAKICQTLLYYKRRYSLILCSIWHVLEGKTCRNCAHIVLKLLRNRAGKYVYKKVDELTKNHKEDTQSFSGQMMEVKGNLDPNCFSRLPLKMEPFKRVRVTLVNQLVHSLLVKWCQYESRFVHMVCKHCLRATTLTVLVQAGVPSHHIMKLQDIYLQIVWTNIVVEPLARWRHQCPMQSARV